MTDTSLAALKPCPFCDGAPEWAPDPKHSKVQCSNEDCEAQTGCWYPRTEAGEAKAIAAWNTRAEQSCAEKDAEIARLREALEWYGEQARLCRLIHSEGDAGRAALSEDGGKCARAALGEQP